MQVRDQQVESSADLIGMGFTGYKAGGILSRKPDPERPEPVAVLFPNPVNVLNPFSKNSFPLPKIHYSHLPLLCDMLYIIV